MGAILLAIAGMDPKPWEAGLRLSAPDRDLRLWPDRIGAVAEVAYACVWRPPHGLLATFPNLKAVINLGAGVDHLLADPALPPVPLARVVHADLTTRMVEYVVLHVLMHHRRQRQYDAQQRDRIWQVGAQPAASEVAVGVMGLGAIGGAAARALARIGFKVAGWSRLPRSIAGVEAFHGATGLDPFLTRSEILVCLLPATPETKGLLALPLLRKLKRDGAAGGAYLINASRGALQIDTDILAALEQGTLAGATLDVFQEEPLPAASPLWTHPHVTITPHNAGDISPQIFAPGIIEQIERLERGLPLDNLIDRNRGY
jgi:glyoxylate/hydroxypyruvate reductase A